MVFPYSDEREAPACASRGRQEKRFCQKKSSYAPRPSPDVAPVVDRLRGSVAEASEVGMGVQRHGDVLFLPPRRHRIGMGSANAFQATHPREKKFAHGRMSSDMVFYAARVSSRRFEQRAVYTCRPRSEARYSRDM